MSNPLHNGDSDEANHGTPESVDRVAPWWIKTVFYFGAPTVAAGYFIWILTSQAAVAQATMLENQRVLITNLATHMEDSTREGARNTRQLEQIERLLFRICINTAVTSADRVDCFR